MTFKIRNASLQTKIILIFILLGLLLTSAFNIFYYKTTLDNALVSKENELSALAQMTSNKIERFLFERTADIEVLKKSNLLTSELLSSDDIKVYLENVMKAYQTYDAIFLLNEKGTIKESVGIDHFNENEVSLIKHFIGASSYTSDITLAQNQYNIYFSEPLTTEDGTYVGAIVEKMNFDAIFEIINQITIGKTGFVQLEQVQETYNKNLLKEEIFDNETYYTLSYPLKKYDTQKDQWIIKVYQSKKEVLAFKKSFEKYILLVLMAALLLFSISAYFISMRVTQPIRHLMKKTTQMIEDNKAFSNQLILSDEAKTLTSFLDVILEELHFMMQQVLEKSGEAAYIDEIRNSITALFDQIPNGMITVDSKGKITSINTAAKDILKIDAESSYSDIMNSPRLKPLLDSIHDSLYDDLAFDNEIIYIDMTSDEAIPVIYSTLLQRDLHDNVIGLTLTFSNYHHKKNFEESILRAKNLAELGQMSAGVAHEIRNPLASIKGYAQLALKACNEDSILQQDIQIILNEANRLETIVDRFMNFANPNAPVFQVCHLNQLIKDTIRQIQKGMKLGTIHISHKFTNEDTVLADPGQLKQVILNIILNSIQALPEGGHIEIISNINHHNKMMEIKILDDGEGMPDEVVSKAFSPFFTTRPSGTGLGLSICSRIIENHKGIMDITSALNAGTQVVIKLPFKEFE